MSGKGKDELDPPITLYSQHVLEWASTSEPVEFTDRVNAYVNGERLWRVPYLAIGKDMDSGEFFLHHCDDGWQSICSYGFTSLEETKKAAEIGYRNISQQWVETGTTKEEALAELNETYKEMFCSFCGQRFDKVKSIYTTEKAAICDGCIVEFHNEIKETKEENINEEDDTV